MRLYFNPCYRHSFEKSEKKGSNSEQVKIMRKSDHNFNRSEDSTTSLKSNEDERLRLNNETFDLNDTYRPEEALAIEYRSHEHSRQKQQRKKFLICCVITILTLLIIAGIIAYVIMHIKNTNRPTSSNCTSDNCRTTGRSIKEKNSNNNGNRNGHVTKPATHKHVDDETCGTEKCAFIANNLKNSMNFSADPCENFHEYACGLWAKTHPLPPSMPKLDTMGLLNLNKNRYLRDIIETEMQKTHTQKGFKTKLVKFYRSCQNLATIDERGKMPLLRFISSFGKWSPLKVWSEEGEGITLTEQLIKSHQYFTGSVYDDRMKSPMFKAIVKVNDGNSSQHILEFNLPDLPISDPTIYTYDNDFAKKIRAKYRLLQTNYVALLGPANNADKLLDDLMKFEIELANISIQSSYIRNIMQQYNLTTIKEMSAYVGTEINWLQLIRGYFKDVPNVRITENTKIGVRSIDYFKALNDFIKRTPKQLVQDYIIWVCVWRFGYYASAPFREANYNFQKTMLGIRERPDRWKQCIVDIEETMEFGLASLYVEKALTEKDKKLASEIVKNITNQFRRNLVNVEWMDVGTKAKAFEKVDSIAQNIGYPDYVKNETYLDMKYERVNIKRHKYFENSLNMYKEKRVSNMMLINQPVDRTAYDLPPTLVEAYFDPNKNKMVFLAGILHVPFYDTKGPINNYFQYLFFTINDFDRKNFVMECIYSKPVQTALLERALNYGALGLVVGHEVTHAFDDLGRQFDGNGEKVNWWSKSSTQAFYERSSCMMKQYGNYSMYGINVDGRLTLGENIADNGGIKVAYLAYKDWERTHGKEKKLPGIPLTMDQLLFVSHGQVWCGAYREEYVKTALKTDYHSPAKYRIIGPLSNLKEFSDAFNCPLGSQMNPIKKCRVW